MAALRGLILAGTTVLAAVSLPSPASAYWGGYRGYGYGYGGFGPGFGAGLAFGGLYGGYYPRPYAYPAPYYLPPPVVYLPPPVFLPPAYAVPPRPRPVVHRIHPVRAAQPAHRLQPRAYNVPAVLRDGSPGL